MDGMEQAVQGLPLQYEKMLVFFSYARQDKALRDQLEEHLSNLKYRGLITTWHEREVTAGAELQQQIDAHLDEAQIILLLISSSFMASDYCYGVEMTRALARHTQGEARVIPILLRPVMYTGAPFAFLKMLPTNGKPVVSWRNRDSAFVDIALNIEQAVDEYQEAAAVSSAFRTGSHPPASGFGSGVTAPGQQSGYGWQSPQPPSLGSSTPAGLAGLPTLPPSARSASRRRSWRFALAGLLIVFVIGGLLVLQANSYNPGPPHQPNPLDPLLLVALGLLILAGLFIAILLIFLVFRNRREKAAQRRRQEADVATEDVNALTIIKVFTREQKEVRRRERAEAERREQEEALIREREEARRQRQERVYFTNALVAYERALLLNPRDVTALQGKANALDGLGCYSEALETFQQAIALAANATTYSHLGDVFTKLKRYDDALAAYGQAIALDPTLADAYSHMSNALDQLGRGREAEQAREKAKELGY